MWLINKFHSLTRSKRIILYLFIVAVLLRGLYVAYVFHESGTTGWKDARLYLQLGQEMATGNWSAPMIVAPLVPMIVALFVLLFNNPVIPFLIFNVLISGLVVVVLYHLGKELYNNLTGFLIALWGVAFIDSFRLSAQILKEPALFLLLPLLLLLLLRSIRSKQGSLKYAFLSAIAFVLLIHTDERFIIYMFFLPFVFLFRQPFQLSVAFKQMAIWSVVIILLMAPWTIRNYYVFDQLVVLTPRTTAFTSKLWGDNLSNMNFSGSNKESVEEISEKRLKRAEKFEKKHGITPRLYGKNEARIRAFVYFWRPLLIKPTYIQHGYRGQYWTPIGNLRMMAYYGIFLPFFIFGFYYLIKKKMYPAFFFALIPVIHSLLHAYMVWAIIRYRAPILFIVVMTGIFVMVEIANRFFSKKSLKLLK